MSWPVPSSSASSQGPIFPVQLPWAAREVPRPLGLPVQIVPRRRNKASIRKAKYGCAMLAGLVVVHLAKKVVNSIPVINIITRPVLDLVPTILAGPALGAALVYGIEEGDLLAARHVVREKVQHVRQEIDEVVRDLSAEVHSPELTRQLEASQGALQQSARVAAQSVAELERTVVPVLEREFRNIERAWQDGKQGGCGGAGWGSH